MVAKTKPTHTPRLTSILTSEVWKDIPGFEGMYQVSDQGRIKSLKRPHRRRDKILRQQKHKDGRMQVGLTDKDGKAKTVKVHRAVAKAFLKNPKNKPQVDHKNGKKDDNRLKNLRWCDNSQNMKSAVKRRKQKLSSTKP